MFFETGTIVEGKYEIRGTIGSGGMGVVYEAYQQSVDRLVALKLLTYAPSGESSDLQRFEREAKILSKLTHPNIVQFYSYGLTSGYPFIVMERLFGTSFQRLQAQAVGTESVVDTQTTLNVLLQICSALEYAHGMGIFHRDIKPSNIILTDLPGREPLAKLIDFGLAKLTGIDGDQKLTQTGNALGSVMYMSPEQCSGSLVDGRTDIYALGCVMYEALVGEPPFNADNGVAVMFQHLNQPVAETDGWKLLSPRQQHVIAKCLAKSPDDRYNSVVELQDDLQDLLSGAQLRSRPVPQRKSAPRKVSFIKLALGLTACSAVVASILMVTHAQTPHVADFDTYAKNAYRESTKYTTRNPQRAMELLTDADAVTNAHPREVDTRTKFQIKSDLAVLLGKSGHDAAQVESLLNAARELSLELTERDQGLVLLSLAASALRRNEPKIAVKEALRAAELFERSSVQLTGRKSIEAHLQSAMTWQLVASCYSLMHDEKANEAACRKALLHSIAAGGVNEQRQARRCLSSSLASQQRYAEAMAEMTEWLALVPVTENSDLLESAVGYEHLGNLRRSMGNPVAAQADYAASVGYASRLSEPLRGEFLGSCYFFQALNYYACGNVKEGDKALAAGNKVFPVGRARPGGLEDMTKLRDAAVRNSS